jgi:hypothetical protein
MLDPELAKSILDKVMLDIPEAASLSDDQKKRLESALKSLASSLYIYPTLPEGSSEREELETKMSYAKLTISSLGALSYVKVEQAVVEAVQDVFIFGVRAALTML